MYPPTLRRCRREAQMKLTLILLVVCLMVLGPMVTASLPMSVSADVALAADGVGDDDNWDFWDWCVLWWTTHLDDWPC